MFFTTYSRTFHLCDGGRNLTVWHQAELGWNPPQSAGCFHTSPRLYLNRKSDWTGHKLTAVAFVGGCLVIAAFWHANPFGNGGCKVRIWTHYWVFLGQSGPYWPRLGGLLCKLLWFGWDMEYSSYTTERCADELDGWNWIDGTCNESRGGKINFC